MLSELAIYRETCSVYRFGSVLKGKLTKLSTFQNCLLKVTFIKLSNYFS